MAQHHFLALLCTMFLTACGGGGQSAAPPNPAPVQTTQPTQPTTTTPPAPEPVELFNDEPDVLRDAYSYYADQCMTPSIQFAIPVNIDNDEQDDFIIHYWCDNRERQVVSTPTPDALVAYVSNGGDYVIDNFGVFGTHYPSLGGASRKYVRGDLNNDGKDDFAFAMNWEDGRSQDADVDIDTHSAFPAVLLSTDTGYEIVQLGYAQWGHSVRIEGNRVFFSGFNNCGGNGCGQVFEYNNGWTDVSDEYPHLSGISFLIKDNYVINAESNGQGIQGLDLIRDGVYVDRVNYEPAYTVQFAGWAQDKDKPENYSEMMLYRINGEVYFHGATSGMCLMDTQHGELVVATVNAAKLADGSQPIEGQPYHETETVPVNFFTFYTIDDDKLVLADVTISGEDPVHNFNFFDCEDVNGDGHPDIVAQVFSQPWNNMSDNNGGVPEVYINEGDNDFYNLDTADWPVFSDSTASTQGYLHDINNDGTHDLVMFGLTTEVTENIEIYYTNKGLTD